MPHTGNGTTWDETLPTGSEDASGGDDEIRDLRKALNHRVSKEHDALETKVSANNTGADGGGEHLAGSARAYFQAGAPTALPNAQLLSGSTFADGRIWIDSDNNSIWVYDSSAFEACSTTPTDDSVATAKIQDNAVTAAKIATAVAGNGLAGGGGTALSVTVDDSTIEIDTDELQVKDGGVTTAKLAAGYRPYITCWEQKETTVDAMALTGGEWNERELSNVTNHDSISGVSVGSNRITLPAGTYEFKISSMGFDIDEHRLRLYNVTDDDVEVTGPVANSLNGQNATNPCFVSGRVVLVASKVLAVEHYATTTDAIGGGEAAGDGSVEIYTFCEFWKVA